MPNFRQLTENFYVAPQLTQEDIIAAHDLGFEVLIMNRPAHETPDQPDTEMLVRTAEDKGMSFLHIPITAPPEMPDVNATLSALTEFEGKKILAFCRSGTRSATLWAYAMAKDNTASIETILQHTSAAGYDVSMHRHRLEAIASLD